MFAESFEPGVTVCSVARVTG
ncbi:hypothetical protein NKI34_29175 [Mesorhizobium sp. M0700]